LSVPPRYSIAMTIGYLKGKSATRIHRELLHTKDRHVDFGTGREARRLSVLARRRADGIRLTR
jgi:hypothetical protein